MQVASSFGSQARRRITNKLKKNFFMLTKTPSRIAIGVLDLYRMTIGVSFGGQCRFYPSCSTYARLALKKHGLIKGGTMALWRLVRCNPFNHGGVDEP